MELLSKEEYGSDEALTLGLTEWLYNKNELPLRV